jgi:hypothetical protein
MRPKPPPIAAVAPEPQPPTPVADQDTPENRGTDEDDNEQENHELFERLLEPSRELSSGNLVTYQRNEKGKPQVVSYNHDNLVVWGGIGAAFSKPSIFRLRKSLVYQVMALILFGVSSYFVMWIVTQDTGGTPKYWSKQMSPLFDLSSYLNAVVAFILGLFISLNLQRWWMLRAVHVQSIVKCTRNLVMSIGAILPNPAHLPVRDQMCRHCLLSFRLVFMCARGPVTENSLGELIKCGLLEKDELPLLLAEIAARRASPCFGGHGAFMLYDFDIAEIPLIWNARQVQSLFKEGCFAPPCLSLLAGLCKEAQNGIDSIRMQLNSQLPFSYAHLIATMVQGAALLSAVRCGMLVALATSILSVVCQVFFCFCLSIVYLGLYSMVVVISDPFGDDVIDFPAEQIEHQLWKGCHLLECLRLPPVDATKLKCTDEDDEFDMDEDDGEDGGDDGDDGGD